MIRRSRRPAYGPATEEEQPSRTGSHRCHSLVPPPDWRVLHDVAWAGLDGTLLSASYSNAAGVTMFGQNSQKTAFLAARTTVLDLW